MHIFHITEQATWEAAKCALSYDGDTLSSDGFIHCCFLEQIDNVLENWFKGKRDLVILEINPEKLNSPVKYENIEGGQEMFPHIYGPINIDAVVNEKPIKKGKNDETNIE